MHQHPVPHPVSHPVSHAVSHPARSALSQSVARARNNKEEAMEAELARLRAENSKLRAENATLRGDGGGGGGGGGSSGDEPAPRRGIQWVDEPARGAQPRKLERLRSYLPGEYGAVLPDAEPSETSVSFASDDQPARRRRLKSYSEGEYSSDAPGAQNSSLSAVSFSGDTADEPLPQRCQRLKSYSQGEYGSAMDSSAASAAGSVRFAEAEVEPAAQPRLRQRLKSYSQGEYAPGSPEESASSARGRGVRLETEAESLKPCKLTKLESFDQGQYKGVLTPEEQYRQAMAAAQHRSGKHLWGVARGTMAMAVGLPLAVAKPIASYDPNVAFAEAVLVDQEAAQTTSSLQLNPAMPVFDPEQEEGPTPMDDASSDDSATAESSFTYQQLLEDEEQEHQAELRRIGSGEMPSSMSMAGATSPTKVSDWPSDFASDVAVRPLSLCLCLSLPLSAHGPSAAVELEAASACLWHHALPNIVSILFASSIVAYRRRSSTLHDVKSRSSNGRLDISNVLNNEWMVFIWHTAWQHINPFELTPFLPVAVTVSAVAVPVASRTTPCWHRRRIRLLAATSNLSECPWY